MEPPGRSRLPVDDGAGGGDQAPAVPAARTGGRGRGLAGRAGNRPRAAQGPGIVRKRCGHDLVGGDRVNEWPSGWFRDEKPKPAGGADGPGAARPEAGEPTVGLPAGSAGAAGAAAGRDGTGGGASCSSPAASYSWWPSCSARCTSTWTPSLPGTTRW